MPKVSVILTSFNHRDFLHASIDSVIAQTFQDFELIIIDDGSTDESWDIISNYPDPRVITFRATRNTGGVPILNHAITDLLSGEFIAIHHSDDIWDPRKLEEQIAVFEMRADIGAVFTWAEVVDERRSVLKDTSHFYYNIFEQNNHTRHEWLNLFLTQGNVLCHPSVLIRRECYEKCGLYTNGMAQITDLDMWVRLCLKFEIFVLPKKLIQFRVLDNERNASGCRPETVVRCGFEFYRLLENFYARIDFSELEKIFPSAKEFDRGVDTILSIAFGMTILKELSSPVAQLFALNLLFQALSEQETSNIAKEKYEFDHLAFIQLSGKYDVFSRMTLS